jgi:hypothetical protein
VLDKYAFDYEGDSNLIAILASISTSPVVEEEYRHHRTQSYWQENGGERQPSLYRVMQLSKHAQMTNRMEKFR